jgi:hypothetical protein
MIKEFCKESKTAVIRNNHYGSNLQMFNEMFEEALLDFPNLQMSEVTIVHYGGERYAKTFGIEFTAIHAPSTYARIGQLELTK